MTAAGDVAMVECSDGEWRRAMCVGGDEWVFASGGRRRVDQSAARPLLTIDAENYETVTALTAEMCRMWDRARTATDQPYRGLVAHVQQMLRLVRDGKPKEPSGIGAVVRDDNGDLWVRVGFTHGLPWRVVGASFCANSYAHINAVEVLARGVE